MALISCFEGLQSLEFDDCSGPGILDPRGWSILLRGLRALEKLTISEDYHLESLTNEVIDELASVVLSQTKLAFLRLEFGSIKTEFANSYPAIRNLVRNCRGSLILGTGRCGEFNFRYVYEGLLSNLHLEQLSLDLFGCLYSSEDYCGLFQAVKEHQGLQSLKLDRNGSTEDEFALLDDNCGASLRDLLYCGTLTSLTLSGFQLSRSLMKEVYDSSNCYSCLSFLDLAGCLLEDGSLPVVTAALPVVQSSLKSLHIATGFWNVTMDSVPNYGNSPMDDVRCFLKSLSNLQQLEDLECVGTIPPGDQETAILFVALPRQVPTIQAIDHVEFPLQSREQELSMLFYLKLNRYGRRFIVQSPKAVQIPMGLWPVILARATGHKPGSDSNEEHVLFHFLRSKPALVRLKDCAEP